MGDRAMAEIKTKEGSLYLYTHWGGNSLPDRAKEAIKFAKGRWSDTPYAVRILVDQLTKEGRDEQTGFGLMLTPNAEDEYNRNNPSVVIDLVAYTLEIKIKNQVSLLPFEEITSRLA